MAIAATLKEYLDGQGLTYDLVRHAQTGSSGETAHAAHVSGRRIAKAVVLEDDSGYVMAVVPANHHVHLGQIHQKLNRFLGLATESELGQIFTDCKLGAVPPVGPAYGMETVVDESLLDGDDVYFEAGDHEALVHMSGDDFRRSLGNARMVHFD